MSTKSGRERAYTFVMGLSVGLLLAVNLAPFRVSLTGAFSLRGVRTDNILYRLREYSWFFNTVEDSCECKSRAVQKED